MVVGVDSVLGETEARPGAGCPVSPSAMPRTGHRGHLAPRWLLLPLAGTGT